MARKVTSSALTGALSSEGQGCSGGSVGGYGTPTVGLTSGRNGLAAITFGTALQAARWNLNGVIANGAGGVSGRRYYGRGYIRLDNLPASTLFICGFFGDDSGSSGSNAGSGSDMAVGARLATDGTLTLRDSGASAPAGSIVLSTATWYRLELMAMVNTAGNDEAELRVNGTTIATFSGASFANTGGTQVFTDFRFMAQNMGMRLCDVALNDDQVPSGFSAGDYGAQDTWAGPGAQRLLLPVSDITAGVAGEIERYDDGSLTNIYEGVNNVPSLGWSGGGQAGVKLASGSNAFKDYEANLATPNDAGVPADETIKVAQRIMQIGDNSSQDINATMQTLSNPTDVANTVSTSGNITKNPERGAPLYLPTINRGSSPQMRLRRQALAGGAWLMGYQMGLYIESGDPAAGGQLMCPG